VALHWSIDEATLETLTRLLPHRLLRYAARACCIAHAHRAETVVMALNQAIHGEHEFGVIGQFCDPSKISIDIGAAEGLYLYVLQKHSAACVGFEPNPLSYQHLKSCFSGVRLESCALSSASGESELRVPVVDEIPYCGFGTIERENDVDIFRGQEPRRISVPVRTLDSFGFENVGMIKIDVEGHEWDVIRGAIETIERSRPNLMIEIEERHKKGNFAKINEFFEARGYDAFFLKDGRLCPIAAFDFATMQNPEGEIRPGVYYNNFFFLSSPPRDARPAAAEEETSTAS
jgi:FkbM family methyltransferase